MASIAEDQLDVIGSRFRCLGVEDRDAVMRAEPLVKFASETKAVYSYITEMCEKGKNEMTVPAMLVPAMLGMAYETKDNRKDYTRQYLRVHGEEGADWVFRSKTSIFFNEGANSLIEIPVPGRDSEKIVFRRDAGNAAKFAFVTPHFARVLMLRSTSQVGRELAEFYLAVHDEVIKFLRGDASKFDTLKRTRTGDDLEDISLEREMKRIKIEEASVKVHDLKMKQFSSDVELMREMFGWDDRDRIYYKDFGKSIMNESRASQNGRGAPLALLVDDDPRGGEISIPMICNELGVNPRGKNGQIGKCMARLWRAEHPGEKCPKRETLYNGKPYMENTYYRCDYDLLVQAIRTVTSD